MIRPPQIPYARPRFSILILLLSLLALSADAAPTAPKKKLLPAPHKQTAHPTARPSPAKAHPVHPLRRIIPAKPAPSTRHPAPLHPSKHSIPTRHLPPTHSTKHPSPNRLARHTTPIRPTPTIPRESLATRLERDLTATPAPFTFPENLTPFFTALHARTPDTQLRILQYGDSHTAADFFSGELRSRLQTTYGNGGLGFQFPGHPFAGYHLSGSDRTQSAGWFTEGNRFTDLGTGDLGLGGISIATTQPGQTIALSTTCETLQLHFLRQPTGGRLQFTDNATPISIVETADTSSSGSTADASRAGTFSYACVAGPHDFTFTTLDAAPVKLLGIVTGQPGITYECLGINGAVAPLILRWNQLLFSEYLARRDPALIVLAYGSNEAGGTTEGYADLFAQLLDTLHRDAPNAAVLVLGPYDRQIAHVTLTGRGRRQRRSVSWSTLGGIDRIIAAQREACSTHHCTFYDTRRRMGGPGSLPRWIAAGWAQPDHTHLTATGYRALADALYTDLQHLDPTPPTP